jgi:FtsP/CotA-like multicopper oxidase with cupredoxin domain
MKPNVFIFLAVLLATSGGFALAQTDDQKSETVGGIVVSSGNTSLAVRTDTGATMTFVIGTSTVMPTTPVTAGQRVTVRYRPLDSSRSLAVSVALGGTTLPKDTAPTPSVHLVGLVGMTALAGVLFLRMLGHYVA